MLLLQMNWKQSTRLIAFGTLMIMLTFHQVAAHGGDSGEAETDEDAKQKLRNSKGGVIIGVFFLTLLSSALPWFISKYLTKAISIVMFGAAISGGIILGAALTHLFPGATEAWTEYFEIHGASGLRSEEDVNYPFAALFTAITIILLIGVDAVFVSQGMEHKDHHGHAHPHNHSHIIPQIPSSTTFEKDVALETKSDNNNNNGDVNVNVMQQQKTITTQQSDVQMLETSRGSKKQIMQAYVYFIALSLHSIFDGLSVGAENSLSGFHALIAAVLSHKAFDGFALGVPVYFAKLSPFQTVFALVFCASMTPLGIAIAMAVTEPLGSEQGLLAQAIILSISCGSFLFISLIELLPSSLSDGKWIKTKLFLIFIGWGVMALIGLWV